MTEQHVCSKQWCSLTGKLSGLCSEAAFFPDLPAIPQLLSNLDRILRCLPQCVRRHCCTWDCTTR